MKLLLMESALQPQGKECPHSVRCVPSAAPVLAKHRSEADKAPRHRSQSPVPRGSKGSRGCSMERSDQKVCPKEGHLSSKASKKRRSPDKGRTPGQPMGIGEVHPPSTPETFEAA